MNIKWIKKCLWLVLIFLFGAVLAQDFDLGFVDIDFCDGSNQLSMQGNAGVQTGFCASIKNLSATTGYIQLALVDGEMSVGNQVVKACKTTASGYFGQFVTLSGLDESNIITLSPHANILQRGTINLPEGFAGVLHGCITMTVADKNAGTGMFNIINRKANIIDISVAGDYVDKFSVIDVHTLIENGGVVLVIGLQNSGYIGENYQIVGNISNNYFDHVLYTQDLSIASGMLYGGDNKEISYTLSELPGYKGKYALNIKVSHTPEAESGLTIKTLPDDIQKDLTLFVYPDLDFFAIVVIVVVLLVLWLIVGMRKKKSS